MTPILRAERVSLQLLPPSEAARAARYQRDNREHLAPWDPPRAPEFFTESFWVRELARSLRELDEDRSARFWVIDTADGEVIGTCNFNNFVRGAFQACHLGYTIDHRREGQGYMSEALRCAIAYVFGPLRMHRIMANYIPENERSARLLERLGFEIEGRARDYLFIGGDWRDHVLTALINPAPIRPA